MLKIYNMYRFRGKIELVDYIDFEKGRYFTGYDGYGDILAEGNKTFCASYVLQHLKSFKEYLQNVKTVDGYLQEFILYNAYSDPMFKERIKDIPKTEEDYIKYGLNEEAILLFTDYINLQPKDENIQKLFGRSPETGMYLLLPNATFEAYTDCTHRINKETYEVMQSKNLGHELVLTKLKRNI